VVGVLMSTYGDGGESAPRPRRSDQPGRRNDRIYRVCGPQSWR